MQIPPPGRDDHARRQRASDAKVHPRGRGGKEGRAVFRQDHEVQDERRRLGAHHEEQWRRWGGSCSGLMMIDGGGGVGRDERREWTRKGWREACVCEKGKA